jgi:hypothetical protein
MGTMWLRAQATLRVAAAAGGILLTVGCSAQAHRPTGRASASVTGSGTQTFSGQRTFGQTVVEPAVYDANGTTVFLSTPSHMPGVPFASVSNPTAAAPMYLPVYPANSTVDPSTLDCQPTNCDHVTVCRSRRRAIQTAGRRASRTASRPTAAPCSSATIT